MREYQKRSLKWFAAGLIYAVLTVLTVGLYIAIPFSFFLLTFFTLMNAYIILDEGAYRGHK